MRSPLRLLRLPAAVAALALALALAAATPAGAWFTIGHAKVARAAVAAVPATMPAFFRKGAWAVGEAAVDPDLQKDRTLAALRAFEEPAHFLDWEQIGEMALPPDRWAFMGAVAERKEDPKAVGMLPYSVIEGVQRLTLTFAEYRRYPEDPYIQQKALVYAGQLAHYAGDLEQPLHTSLHHDGRALPDGSSPHTGIHQLVDGLLEKVPIDDRSVLRDLPVRAMPDAWAAVQSELATSHALVGRVYELEPDLRTAWPPPPPPAPAPGAAGAPAAAPGPPPPPGPISPAVRDFAAERYRATASFLASLYLTAWEGSAAIKLPSWLERPRPPRRHWWQRGS
jgi:hypothetical protein